MGGAPPVPDAAGCRGSGAAPAGRDDAVRDALGKLASNPSEPAVVAGVVWQAANESGDRLRFRAGADAEELLDRRKRQDDSTFSAVTGH